MTSGLNLRDAVDQITRAFYVPKQLSSGTASYPQGRQAAGRFRRQPRSSPLRV